MPRDEAAVFDLAVPISVLELRCVQRDPPQARKRIGDDALGYALGKNAVAAENAYAALVAKIGDVRFDGAAGMGDQPQRICAGKHTLVKDRRAPACHADLRAAQMFGELLRRELTAERVPLHLAKRLELPTLVRAPEGLKYGAFRHGDNKLHGCASCSV